MSRPGSTRILRLALRSPVAAPLTDVQGQGARPDADAGADRSLSAVNLTYHIEPDTTGSDQAIESPRECDCPKRVSRCAHLDGRALLLLDFAGIGSPPYYHVCGGVDYCELSNWYDSEADAIAAFFAAEAEMLGRAL